MPAVTHSVELLQPTSSRPGAARGQHQDPPVPSVNLHDASMNAHAHYLNTSFPSVSLHHHQMLALPPQHTYPWQHPVHIVPSNPYPIPPQSCHKVWILDCRSCGSFLTNRGMKAVLLLRPNVPLYSTDALPVNCSAYSANPDALRRPSQTPARTCDCLTQTLCCHGCGSTIGYMIVIPCSRCTSSITATNRATNGHRFVFHSKEILASERHYIKDEPGIAPSTSSPAAPASALPPPFYPPQLHVHTSPAPPPHVLQPPHHYRPPSASASPRSDYLPTPPLEFAALSPTPPLELTAIASTSPPAESFPFPPLPALAVPPQHALPAPPYTQAHIPHVSSRAAHSPYPMPYADIKDAVPPVQRLRHGDVLYWHHLARSGEIPEVAEDSRARDGCSRERSWAGAGGGSRMAFDR